MVEHAPRNSIHGTKKAYQVPGTWQAFLNRERPIYRVETEGPDLQGTRSIQNSVIALAMLHRKSMCLRR